MSSVPPSISLFSDVLFYVVPFNGCNEMVL